MKLAHIFTLVLGVHAVIIAAVLVQGCASDSETTNAAAAEPAGEPGHSQEQAYRPAAAATRPSPAAQNQGGGVTRYPPTRPDWNISSSPEVVVAPSPAPINTVPTGPQAFVGETLTAVDYEDSSVEQYNTIRSTPSTVAPPPPATTSAVAGKTYIVKKGDVLSKIARNEGASLSEIMALNGFTRETANNLKIGQAILIPVGGSAEPSTPVSPAAPSYTSVPVEVDGASYTVQSGDNLSLIAKKNNSSVRAIMSANNLANDRIVVGQKLLIPTVEPEAAPVVGVPNANGEVTYIVQSGDYLGAIAKRYGVSVKEIMQANGISDPRKLRVGQTLIIPTGLEPVGPAAPTTPKPPAQNVIIGPSQTTPVTTAPAPAPTQPATVVEEEYNFDFENAPVVTEPTE